MKPTVPDFYRDFGVSNAEMHLFSGLPISRILILCYADSWPPRWRFPFLVGISNFAIPNCKDFLSTGFSISQLPKCRWTTFSFRNPPECSDLLHASSSRWTVLIVSHDFVTSDAPKVLSSSLTKYRTPMHLLNYLSRLP
jgi:hypothetical protein